MHLNTTYKIAHHYLSCWLQGNKYYNWYIFSSRLSHIWQKEVEKHYTGTPATPAANGSHKKIVVAVCNGWVESGGWADRLKGILSTFILCRENHWDFRLHYVHPFNIEMYLTPSTYDWRISTDDLSFDLSTAEPIALEIGSDSAYQARKQKEWLKRKIERSAARQVHVYTNAMFAYTDDYSKAFHELFKTSDRLEARLKDLTESLGKEYISVSARFLNALGDFNDTVQVEPLPEDKKHALIEGCLNQIRGLHKAHPDKAILVNSDSNTFLQASQQLPYTKHIDGNIVHFDTAEGNGYDTFEKTFIDFFLISHATCVYRLKTRWMHNTGFPYAAARINNTPFSSITFNLHLQ